MQYAATSTRSHTATLQDLSKYRQPARNSGMVTQLMRQNVVGGPSRSLGKYRREAIAQQQVGQGDTAAAVLLAQQNSNIIFERGLFGGGTLYELRAAHGGHYADVEDGFTESRGNYDESTVTLQQLAEVVKTLKRDLARARVL